MRAPTSASTAAPLRSPVLPSTLAPALATLLVACLGLDEGVPTPDAGPPPDAPAVDASAALASQNARIHAYWFL